MLPRVSVVMANHNYARYLRRAIGSALGQSLRDLELIVVDDGSTDESRSIIESVADPRLRFRFVEHLGQPRAKNAGIEWAAAPLVAFLDADDAWHPDKLAKQVALFDRDPALGVAYCRRTLIDEVGDPLPYVQPPLHRGDVMARMWRDNFVCFSSAVVRRHVLEHVGGFDPVSDLAIDYDLWLRVAAHYRFDYVDEPLVEYRCGHGNLSARVGERLRTALLMMRRCLRRGRHRLPARALAAGLAETHAHLAVALRPWARAASARRHLQALRADLRHVPSWRGLLSLALPTSVRRLLRRGDWESAYCTPENDPANA